ncbi:MAG: energy transducer TonB family protein [Methylovirgula sp.]
MSTFADTILPRREDAGLRRWTVAALAVLAAHVALVIALVYMRQSEMPPGNPPDAVMINLAPIAVAPPPQQEVETPPQPQEVQPQTPPQPVEQQQQTVQMPVAPDLVEAPQPEVMMAPPPPKSVQHEAKEKPQHARPRTNLRRAAKSAAPTPGFNGEAAESWRSEIVERISSVKEYPEAARPASGTAVVAFSVDRSGRITSARLVRSSGSAMLDEAAVATVRRADPVPAPPAGVPGGHFTIPLHFSG